MNGHPQHDRRNRILAASLFAALFVAYAYFYQAGGWNQNTRFALVRSILEQHTLKIDDTSLFGSKPVTGDIARHDGNLYCDKAPGASFTALPAVAAARPFVADPSSKQGIAVLSWVATLATSALPGALTGVLVFLLARHFAFGAGAGVFAALSFGLATPAWAYATLMYGHALAAACLLGAYAAAVALSREEGPRRDALLAVAVGLGGGWATVSEYPSAAPAAVLALLALAQAWSGGRARRLRVTAGIAAGALACAALLAWHNDAAFGSALTLGYAKEAGSFGGLRRGFLGVAMPKMRVLREILFGEHRGLLRHAPVLAMAPLGIGLLLAGGSTRRAGLAATAIVAWYLLLNSAYFYWDGGATYGPRHLAPALPFLGVGLAALWAQAQNRVRGILVAFAAGSAFATLVAVSTQPQGPERFGAPWTELNWPSFVQGKLALNQQAFVEYQPVGRRDPVAHSWNLGQKMGLRGLASLLPLFGAWLAIFAVARRAIGREAELRNPGETAEGAGAAGSPSR